MLAQDRFLVYLTIAILIHPLLGSLEQPNCAAVKPVKPIISDSDISLYPKFGSDPAHL